MSWLAERCLGLLILVAEANPFTIVRELGDRDGLLTPHALLLV